MFKKENLRKNFLRVKQIADQNLGRVEKTEVLSDDLQTSEKRVDTVKHVCSNTIKKVGTSLLVTGTTDPEKKLKKMPEAGVGHSMIESANILGTECIMGQMFQMCGECQSTLAQKHLQYELDVEKQVQDPLQDILEVQIPQISKLKKALNKVTLDMDSARGRYQNAVRQTSTPGVNMVSASAKVDTVNQELEETMGRVDQAKDAYTTELFNFISKEADHSKSLLELLEAQSAYHRQALEIIEHVIPKMRETLSCTPTKPVYGMSLEEHLRVTGRDIAMVLEACISYLLESGLEEEACISYLQESGLEEEGLFRIAGMASKVKKLKASFDAGVVFDETGELDPHTVAGAMKQYLRELPEPLLTFPLFSDFMAAAQQPQDQRLQALWCVVDRLPKPNYDNFRYLIKFLAKLTEKSDVNKMSPGNIAIVIGPNLIWSEGDSGPNMMNTGILSLITELIVQHADWFFPGAQDFHACQRGQAPEHRMSNTAHHSGRSRGNRNSYPAASAAHAHGSHRARPHPSSATTPQEGPNKAMVSSAYGALTSQMSSGSPDTSSASSESTSLSDVPQQVKDYERAETLERRDSVDNYHTAKGDLQASTFPVSRSSASMLTNKPTNPVIVFNPNDRDRCRKPGFGTPRSRSGTPSTPEYAPQSPSGGPHSVHGDMYDTVFALQSLGDGGTWPSYLSKVRAMWDDQLQKHSQADGAGNHSPGVAGNRSPGVTPGTNGSTGKGHSRSRQEIDFAAGSHITTAARATPVTPGNNNNNVSPVQDHHANLNRSGSDQSGGSSSQGTPRSSPANQERAVAPPQTPPTVSRSPSISPVMSNANLQQTAPLAESEDTPTGLSVRRPTRKPAPPPPERPYSVAVSASVRQNDKGAQFQTWPRNAISEDMSSSATTTKNNDKQKTLPHDRPDRPVPPERTSVSFHGHERPKIPPPVVPPSHHQRSASTGAVVTIPGVSGGAQLHHSDTGSGNVTFQIESVTHGSGPLLSPQDRHSSNGLNNRQSVARPARPLPPPPPPPDNIVEETHL